MFLLLKSSLYLISLHQVLLLWLLQCSQLQETPGKKGESSGLCYDLFAAAASATATAWFLGGLRGMRMSLIEAAKHGIGIMDLVWFQMDLHTCFALFHGIHVFVLHVLSQSGVHWSSRHPLIIPMKENTIRLTPVGGKLSMRQGHTSFTLENSVHITDIISFSFLNYSYKLSTTMSS